MAAIGNSLMKSHISQDLGVVDPSEKIQIFPEKMETFSQFSKYFRFLTLNFLTTFSVTDYKCPFMPKMTKNYVCALYSRYFMHDLRCTCRPNNNISRPVRDLPTTPRPQLFLTPRIDAPALHVLILTWTDSDNFTQLNLHAYCTSIKIISIAIDEDR